MHIYKMKVEFGSPITFWGGISIQEIPLYGTAGEVRKETREVTLELSESGGYITVPPQEIQKNVSFENLCMRIDTARELSRI